MNQSASQLLEQIAQAFAHRRRPEKVTPPEHPDTDIYEDAERLSGRDWATMTCKEWDDIYTGFFGLNAEAHGYFLPGIMSSQVRENEPDIMLTHSLLMNFEMASDTSLWRDGQRDKWSLLNVSEIEAIQGWVLWLSAREPKDEQDLLERVHASLEKLKQLNRDTELDIV